MQVPLGTRKGTLTLNRKSGEVSGLLSILGHEERITGLIEPDGACSFDGSLITLTRSITFHAVGKLDGPRLELELTAEL